MLAVTCFRLQHLTERKHVTKPELDMPNCMGTVMVL